MNPVLSHLDAFVAQFHPYGTNSNAYRGMKEKSYRLNFSAMREEAQRITLRDVECPLFADYSVTKSTLLSLAGVGDVWDECEVIPTYFRKSTIKNARNFVGPQPSRAFFRLYAAERFDPERNKTVLLKPREIAFFLAQYRTKAPFADGRSLRFPATGMDGKTFRYVAPVTGDDPDGTKVPGKASLTPIEPGTQLAASESWILVTQVICL
jgi:hypothetical protein